MKEPPPMDSHFLIRKIHSLFGLIPIGVFLCFHLFMNSKAIKEGSMFFGKEFTFASVVKSIEGIHPSRIVLNLVELFVIIIPLLFHGIYGLVIWWQGKTNVLKYGYFRNWMYLIQRWTGIFVFIFLVFHVVQLRLSGSLPDLAFEPNEVFPHLHHLLAGPWLVFYIIGLLAASFHFANGLWLFGITWGITIGPRSQRISTGVALVVFVLLVVLGGMALYGFAALEPATQVAVGHH